MEVLTNKFLFIKTLFVCIWVSSYEETDSNGPAPQLQEPGSSSPQIALQKIQPNSSFNPSKGRTL